MNPCHLFIVGTGRCGTESLSDLINQITDCHVIHEHKPALLDEVTAYQQGRLSRSQLIELLRQTRSPQALGGSRLSGESNQRLSFILPELAEAFPQAKYLWLLRDGRPNVASMVHRYWYHPREAAYREYVHEPSARNRIRGDQVGEINASTWAKLDYFARCTWYWSYTNRTIAAQAKALHLDMWFVRLEDLDRRLPELMQFLGLPESQTPKPVRSNAARHGQPLSWKHWPSHWRQAFVEYGASLMDLHYPHWRHEFDTQLSTPAQARQAQHRYGWEQWKYRWTISLNKWRRGKPKAHVRKDATHP